MLHIDMVKWVIHFKKQKSYREAYLWNSKDDGPVTFFDWRITKMRWTVPKHQWNDEERHSHMQRFYDWIPYIKNWILDPFRPPVNFRPNPFLNEQIREWKKNKIKVLDFSFRKKPWKKRKKINNDKDKKSIEISR